MMKEIFNSERIIKNEKIDDYLLSSDKPKGKYFLSKNFDKESLITVLKNHFTIENYISERENSFGINLVFEGNIICPNNQEITLRSIWHLPFSSNSIIFVTAYRIKND